jgi:hypothetical protein
LTKATGSTFLDQTVVKTAFSAIIARRGAHTTGRLAIAEKATDGAV